MTDLVSQLFIAMIPIDFKITNFSLYLLNFNFQGCIIQDFSKGVSESGYEFSIGCSPGLGTT